MTLKTTFTQGKNQVCFVDYPNNTIVKNSIKNLKPSSSRVLKSRPSVVRVYYKKGEHSKALEDLAFIMGQLAG
ncbi:MAG: hypothetical protein IJN92_08535 [Lachnospiraceae bacterium]|nr:hypothetical protein [Lachnospiraceae bacterium]